MTITIKKTKNRERAISYMAEHLLFSKRHIVMKFAILLKKKKVDTP